MRLDHVCRKARGVLVELLDLREGPRRLAEAHEREACLRPMRMLPQQRVEPSFGRDEPYRRNARIGRPHEKRIRESLQIDGRQAA